MGIGWRRQPRMWWPMPGETSLDRRRALHYDPMLEWPRIGWRRQPRMWWKMPAEASLDTYRFFELPAGDRGSRILLEVRWIVLHVCDGQRLPEWTGHAAVEVLRRRRPVLRLFSIPPVHASAVQGRGVARVLRC